MNLILCALSLLPLLTPTKKDEWSQWRGPNRDGVAVNARLPKTWPAQMPKPLWTAKVGIGYASPVISDGRVFIMGREKEGEESFFCFDANTGERLWRTTGKCDFVPPDPTAGKGPNSTPTVDGDRVYMLGLGGMFLCLDVKTGQPLWKHDFQKEYWGVEKAPDGDDAWFPPCGVAASPLVEGNQVIVPVGGKKVGAMAAFDRRSGSVLWHALPERSSYASPLLADLAGVKQIVGFTGLRMAGLDANSHKLLWELPFPAMFEQTIITPVIWKDHVIVSGEAKPTTALKIGRKDDKVVQEVAWRNPDICAYLVTPVVVKDRLIGLDQRSKKLASVDLATGKTVWTSPRIGKFLSLVVVGDQVLVLNDTGELIVLDGAATTYAEKGRWKVSEAGGIWSYLAVNGSRLYVKDKETLLCYDLGERK